MPVDLSGELAGVGVDEELLRIEAVAGRGLVRAVDAEAIGLAGEEPAQIAMPDLVGAARQFQARDFLPAGRVEEAELDRNRVGGEEREIDPAAVKARAEWKRVAVVEGIGGRASQGRRAEGDEAGLFKTKRPALAKA